MSALTSSSSQSNPNSTTSIKTLAGDKDSKLQIFLGGSCNPTTWRQNVAIPYLEMNGISYYNPQVDNWTPEVVNYERNAKQNAQILLFVIDKQTRSAVSLVESAFMAGDNKNLVLVIYPFDYNIVSLTDTSQQTSNIIETKNRLIKTRRTMNETIQDESSSYVRASSSKSSSTLITNSSTNAHDDFNSESSASQASTTTTTSLTSASANCLGGGCLIDQKSLEESSHEEAKQASCAIRMSGEVISTSEFQELKEARFILKDLVNMRKIPIYSDILLALKYVSSRLNESIGHGEESSKHSPKLLQKHKNTSLNILDQEQSSMTTTDQTIKNVNINKEFIKDVYLSLDCDDHTNIESAVIPILKEKGLTYNYTPVKNIIKAISPASTTTAAITPQPSVDSHMSTSEVTNKMTRYSSSANEGEGSACENSRSAIEKEICAIKSSRVLLFVISNKCRGLSIMVLASHFMALFRNNVVLCVQYLEEPCSIGGETLTKTAIADYNRGRVYLCDYANKSQVPVFSTIGEAIECCSRKCGYINKS